MSTLETILTTVLKEYKSTADRKHWYSNHKNYLKFCM